MAKKYASFGQLSGPVQARYERTAAKLGITPEQAWRDPNISKMARGHAISERPGEVRFKEAGPNAGMQPAQWQVGRLGKRGGGKVTAASLRKTIARLSGKRVRLGLRVKWVEESSITAGYDVLPDTKREVWMGANVSKNSALASLREIESLPKDDQHDALVDWAADVLGYAGEAEDVLQASVAEGKE